MIPILPYSFRNSGNQINSNIFIALLASIWRASVCDWQRIGKCINTRVQFRSNQIVLDQPLSNEAWNEYRPLAITATVDISNVALYKPVAG